MAERNETDEIKNPKKRKPGARARWCPACRRIRPKGKPRGMSFTPERGRALALAAAARRRRIAQAEGADHGSR